MTDRIARLDSRALIRVAGPDTRPFLHNLLTQDVETLKPGELRFGAMLSPPGRLLFDLFLWGKDDAVVLDVAAERRDALMVRLGMYRLRAQVEITADDRPVFASWPGVAEGFVGDPRLAALGGRALGERTANADEDVWAAHRLAVGVPDPTRDGGQDLRYPIEANFDLLNGIDFGKGCFVGQETTSRMKRRGEIKKRMLPITFDGPPPPEGAEVLNGELRAGEVLTGRDGGAMALMRLDRLEGALTVEGRAVTVRMPDWMGL
ncbi:glycine cleavage system protein T [Brevundimonas sp. AAP58]|uniref:CAF17-like 4Fe-4S cluster assembly/insertion protein YgfZ n=1 Tax=Brevundimonas sp. AAP58 TaxID=1523422 RepID=UPI0006B9095B|nr:folate-binding protein YgfZ [Brevundimonas sp. AAP58]KPF76474.1 glycine cleavage system protein T [Brevundimonas sp. AAP58]